MTTPFQRTETLSLWSLQDLMFIYGQPFSASLFPALFAPGATYLVLDLAFEESTRGKIVPTDSITSSSCENLVLADSPVKASCTGKGPPPNPTAAVNVTSPICLFGDLSTLQLRDDGVWALAPDGTAYGPMGMFFSVEQAKAGVAASGPVGQLYWLFTVASVTAWVGGTELTEGDVPTWVIPAPFYLTIPINW